MTDLSPPHRAPTTAAPEPVSPYQKGPLRDVVMGPKSRHGPRIFFLIGREVADIHYAKCLYAGVKISRKT